MSESNPMLQLSLAPSAPEPEAVPGSTESIQQSLRRLPLPNLLPVLMKAS